MRVAFVLPGKLPVPAVRGGAIESLLNNLLDENEKASSFDAIIFSEYDIEAEKASRKYSSSRFFYIKRGRTYNVLNFLFGIGRKINPPKATFLDINYIVRTLRRLNPDKIIVEGSFLKLIELKKFFPRDKLVFRLHADLIVQVTNETLQVLKSASLFIVASDFLRRRIEQTSGDKTPAVRILRNGIRSEFFSRVTDEKKANLLNRYGISGSEPIIMYVGRIIKSKGIMQLIEALIKAREKAAFHFVLVGSYGSGFGFGDEENDFTSNLRRIVMDNKSWITVTGFVSNSDLPAFYQIATIVVVPSICEDVSPLVVNEAMASGTPLIVTDAGGIQEYITNQCAIVVKRDEQIVENICDSICGLLEEPQRLKAMGSAALINSLDYTSARFYNSFCTILENSVAK